jgi:hypothetical protein
MVEEEIVTRPMGLVEVPSLKVLLSRELSKTEEIWVKGIPKVSSMKSTFKTPDLNKRVNNNPRGCLDKIIENPRYEATSPKIGNYM